MLKKQKIKKVIKGLTKASKTHAKQAKTLKGVIMAVATLLTALFHIYLYGPFSWVPFPGSLRSNVHTFLPEMRLGKEISEGSRVGWSDPRADQLQDEVLRPCRPIVWIPKDELGLAVDEIDQAKGPYESNLSCKSTALDEHGKIKVWGPPPDSQNIWADSKVSIVLELLQLYSLLG